MDYHGQIMNIREPATYAVDRHSCGFKNARHAAAEIACEADEQIDTLRRWLVYFRDINPGLISDIPALAEMALNGAEPPIPKQHQ